MKKLVKITIINGPNLNMLGKRNPILYGSKSLDEINQELKDKFKDIVEFDFFQSNHEGEIIDKIQTLNCDGIIINPASLTHSSIGIRDALAMLDIVKCEMHLSDIYAREEFRQINYIFDVVDYSSVGKKDKGYFDCVDFILANLIKKN